MLGTLRILLENLRELDDMEPKRQLEILKAMRNEIMWYNVESGAIGGWAFGMPQTLSEVMRGDLLNSIITCICQIEKALNKRKLRM